MKALRRLLLAALLGISGCASPTPVATPTAPSTFAPTATPSPTSPPPTPSASAVPSGPTESITCIPEIGPLPSGLQGDPCPGAVHVLRKVVAHIGLPIARLYIGPGPFQCGDIWPGVGSPIVCFGPIVLPGRQMSGWVSFVGTDKVAAVELHRTPGDPWIAHLRAFEVPPAGWVMP